MSFISGGYAEQISSALSAASWAKLAVSFWGEGAIELLGLAKQATMPIEIVCNLESGACNPSVIRDLADKSRFPNTKLFTNERLHAKVYLTSNSLIVGSSNASSNGLAFEADELNGWIEALLVTNDADPRRVAETWFDQVPKKEITDRMLAEAELRWKENRSKRNASPMRERAISVADAFAADATFFRNRPIYVFAYSDVSSDELNKRAAKTQKADATLAIADSWYSDKSKVKYQPGSFFIDTYYGEKHVWPKLPWIDECFWFFRDRGDIRKSRLRGDDPFIIYIFRRPRIRMGGQLLKPKRTDAAIIHRGLQQFFRKDEKAMRSRLAAHGVVLPLDKVLAAASGN